MTADTVKITAVKVLHVIVGTLWYIIKRVAIIAFVIVCFFVSLIFRVARLS